MRGTTLIFTITTLSQLLLPEAAADPTFAQGPRKGPPQEAFTSCEGASVGASCSFSGPRGQVEGTCRAPEEEGAELVCVPERRGPPQEAIDACAESDAGAACSFDSPRGTVEGTCVAPKEGQGLVCAPAEGSRGSSPPR